MSKVILLLVTQDAGLDRSEWPTVGNMVEDHSWTRDPLVPGKIFGLAWGKGPTIARPYDIGVVVAVDEKYIVFCEGDYFGNYKAPVGTVRYLGTVKGARWYIAFHGGLFRS